jgi:hypothetical protein
MKIYILALIMLLAVTQLIGQTKEKTVSSKLTEVTVYLQGAQLVRTASTQLAAGKTELVIRNLSPRIRPASILVKISEKVKLLSVNVKKNYLKDRQPVKDSLNLEKTRDSLCDKIQMDSTLLVVNQYDERVIAANQNFIGTNGLSSTKDLQDNLDLYRKKNLEIKLKSLELEKSLAKNRERLRRISQQLNEINFKTFPETGEVYLMLSCETATMANITLSYFVESAAWIPVYDLRVKDVSSPINLSYKGKIRQSSGEEWKDVKLILSTTDPNLNGNKPELSPWYLSQSYQNQYSKSQAGKGKSSSVTLFEISDPYTIPSDNQQYTLDVAEYSVPAIYEYFAAPRLDPDAFLVAKILNWEDLSLVAGQANIYFENTFVGSTSIGAQTTGDTATFSLGRDKSVTVTRTKQKDFNKKQVIGSNRIDSRSFEITVRNTKKQTINLTIQDQFPVSSSNQIEVERFEHKEGAVNDQSGIITWKMTLEPAKEKKVNFKYQVKYPKNYNFSLD